MSATFPKHPRLKLDSEAYVQLCHEVLGRDGWKCQDCGSSRQLQVHHLRFRSALGGDSLENLITLCVRCHTRIHRPQGSKAST